MKKIKSIVLLLLAAISISCHKEYLAVKPDKALIVPSKLSDLDALLDNSSIMNITPALPVLAADEYWTDEKGLLGYGSPSERNSYLWQKEIFEGISSEDWNKPYQQIFYANIVLETLDNLSEQQNELQWKRIKGSALFFRAWANFHLVNQFAVPYNKLNLDKKVGLPLKLVSDVNQKVMRSSLSDFHGAIVSDLVASLEFLPAVSLIKSRPSLLAAHGLLARIYLGMGEFDKALVHVNQAISSSHQLMDYNALNPLLARPFPLTLPSQNTEVIFYANLIPSYKFISSTLTKVDPNLFESYQNDDLRKELFFTPAGLFKGSYTGNNLVFSGLALDEMYLIKAECLARSDKNLEALTLLNELRVKRIKKLAYQPLEVLGTDEQLKFVFLERRMQLFSRGVRWTDLRRLNLEGRFPVTLKRTLSGVEYVLAANDIKYVYPIPDNEIMLSGIAQNDR